MFCYGVLYQNKLHFIMSCAKKDIFASTDEDYDNYMRFWIFSIGILLHAFPTKTAFCAARTFCAISRRLPTRTR